MDAVRRLLPLVALAAALLLPATAAASQVIARNATRISLKVDAKGRALVTYRAGGTTHRVLAWGAVDARKPSRTRPQVKFRVDNSGGWKTTHTQLWKHFPNVCRPYDGPKLDWLVTACTAPDGSYWALQTWQKALANYGGTTGPWELHLSHWRGPLPVLEVTLDWSYRRFDHLFGRLSYRGTPVYGFRATKGGNPLDTYGRNVYVDTFDSAYGPGWRRENSFLTHTGTGTFCYGFFAHGKHPAGAGKKYRATAIGPGVTPLVTWHGTDPGAYDPALDRVANEAIKALGDPGCKPN
jgi:hypothetical protein